MKNIYVMAKKRQILTAPDNIDPVEWEKRKEENTPINPRRDYTIPYNLEYARITDRLQSHPLRSKETPALYIGYSKYGRGGLSATVFPHRSGLILVTKRKISKTLMAYPIKYIIPGEWGLSRVTDFLIKHTGVREIGPAYIKNAEEIPEEKRQKIMKKNKIDQEDYYDFYSGELDLVEGESTRIRKLELARGLLRSNVWQQRGKVDQAKIAPKSFWRWAPDSELIKGDHRTIKTWWKDALYRKIYQTENGKKYAQEGIDLNLKIAPALQRQKILKSITQTMKEKLLPEYPWEVRGWDKMSFNALQVSVLAGIHKNKNWEEWIENNTPDLEILEDRIEKNISTLNGLPELPSNFFEKFVKKSIEYTKEIKKFKVGDEIKKIVNSEPFETKFIKLKLIVPEFAPPEGWNWISKFEEIEEEIYWNQKSGKRVEFIAVALRDTQEQHFYWEEEELAWKQGASNFNGPLSDKRQMLVYERVLASTHEPGPKTPRTKKTMEKETINKIFIESLERGRT